MSNLTATDPAPTLFESLRLKLAARFIKRLLVRLPHDPSLLARCGLVELNLGHYEAAAGYLRQSRDILPSDPNVHFNLGRALEHLDEWQDALKCYRQAISLAPDFEAAIARRTSLTEKLKENPGHGAARKSPDADSASRKKARAGKGGRRR